MDDSEEEEGGEGGGGKEHEGGGSSALGCLCMARHEERVAGEVARSGGVGRLGCNG